MPWRNSRSALEESLADLARSLRNYLEAIEFNPKRLEEVEERLDLIRRLERKYGGSIEAAIDFARRGPQPARDHHHRSRAHR